MAARQSHSPSARRMNAPALLEFNKAQLQTIRQMCAKDCNSLEFDAFLEMCRMRGLNPLLKHIYAMVLHKDKPDKRQLVITVSVDGQRVIANRTKNYRPDEKPPRFEVDPDLKGDPLNPAGLVTAEVSVYIFSHGGWFPVSQVAYWEEFAPIEDEWAENPATGKRAPTGRKFLKPNWKKMPRVMLAKVAEMQALRKAFPDDFSGLYGEEEMDRTITAASSTDMSPSEMLEEAAREQRQEMLGGPGTMIDWMSGGPLEKVPFGQFFDRSMQFLQQMQGSPAAIRAWEDRNRISLKEFWGYSKGDADELRRQIDKAKAVTVEPEPEPAPPPPPKKPAKPKEQRLEPRKKFEGSLPALKLRDN